MNEDPWYVERRGRWKPESVRLLLVAESAPDDGGDPSRRRFFYDDALTARDSLFREVVRALYPDAGLANGPGGKTPWLQRLRNDGVFLIDLAAEPVNVLSPTDRAAVLSLNIQTTVERAHDLAPAGIVLIKQNVYQLLSCPMRRAGLPVLHDEFIPFPGSGQQKRFRDRFATAIARLPKTAS